MLIKLTGGRIIDPVQKLNGEVQDLYIRDGVMVAAPEPGERIHEEYNLQGRIIMAGAIDLHTHIGGGKVNIARMMLPEDHRRDLVSRHEHPRSGCGCAAPSTLTAGYRYAEMGYTACFEPAMLPMNARQAHLEMGDTPMVDKGAYAMLGSDDFLLRQLVANEDQRAINDYVAYTLNASQAMGLKVVNPGGISAFKFNQRSLNLDESHSHYQGVTPRRIVFALARALDELGVPHPLHIHASNLGVPGNVDTTLNTMLASEGFPIHLTHIQFHSYGTEGDRKFSSGAARIAEAINSNPHVSADVGQILFNQTVTASGDSMIQFKNARHGSPKKSVVMDIECDAGCGVVPFRYRDQNFVNALQWAIGLEIFLLVDDPWRIFLTTDHPNGAPFTSYPHLIRLLMDKSFRDEKLAGIDPTAAAMSTLGSINREYSLYEIAILTRAAPARTLGMKNMGHLSPGAVADVVVYREDADREAMFTAPELVFRRGQRVVKNGRIEQVVWGDVHVVKPDYDRGIERRLQEYHQRYQTINPNHVRIHDEEIPILTNGGGLQIHRCSRHGGAL
jgi:formylmethanofuran dehydrogenase subunit A